MGLFNKDNNGFFGSFSNIFNQFGAQGYSQPQMPQMPKILDRKAKVLFIIALSLLALDLFGFLLPFGYGIGVLSARCALRISAAIIFAIAISGLYKRSSALSSAFSKKDVQRFVPVPILLALEFCAMMWAKHPPFELRSFVRTAFFALCASCVIAGFVLVIILMRSIKLRAIRIGVIGDELDIFISSIALVVLLASWLVYLCIFFLFPQFSEDSPLLASLSYFIPEIAGFALLIYSTVRSLSKNRFKRGEENNAFLSKKKKLSDFFTLQKNRWRDRKTNVYKKCPDCKAVLRLPRKKGKHSVSCPRCHAKFSVKISWE